METTPQILSPLLNKQDKSVLYSINSFIEEELSYLSSYDLSKERFLIYKQALNKILDYVQGYRVLLGSIKKEYELCIHTLEKGQIETEKVKLELNKTTTHPATLLNLNKRKDELLIKISELKYYNEELKKRLNQQINDNKQFRPEEVKEVKKYAFLNFFKQKQDEDIDVRKNLIPGLNIDQSTDLKYLSDLLEGVESKIKYLNFAKNAKYSSKTRKQDLQQVLFNKILTRDDLQAKNDALKRKVYLYRLALNAAKVYYDGNSQYSSILDALTKSIINGSLMKQIKLEDESDQVEENFLESEAEFILDYIDKFNELFENGAYRDAAYFAAASPRGVLRNIETMHRFKGVCNVDLGDNDPLLMYCSALLDSINGESTIPDENISLECIKIAILHEKIDMLTRWVAERRLRFTFVAAKLIEEYVELKAKFTKKGLELALFIYTDINATFEAAICMAKLGRFTAMIEYLSSNEIGKNADVYLKILHECPDANFATILADSEKLKNLIKIEHIVSVLLDSSQPTIGLKFLKLQIDRLPTDDTVPLDEKSQKAIQQKKEKLKASYDTLNKYAFLAHNESKMDEKTMNELRNSMEELKSKIGDSTVNENLRHIIEDKVIPNHQVEHAKLIDSDKTEQSTNETQYSDSLLENEINANEIKLINETFISSDIRKND